MMPSNFAVKEFETIQVMDGWSDKPIATFRKLVRFEPYPPNSVLEFIKWMRKNVIPLSHEMMLTYSDLNRDEIVEYFKKIGYRAERLFYMSILFRISQDEYLFLVDLV